MVSTSRLQPAKGLHQDILEHEAGHGPTRRLGVTLHCILGGTPDVEGSLPGWKLPLEQEPPPTSAALGNEHLFNEIRPSIHRTHQQAAGNTSCAELPQATHQTTHHTNHTPKLTAMLHPFLTVCKIQGCQTVSGLVKTARRAAHIFTLVAEGRWVICLLGWEGVKHPQAMGRTPGIQAPDVWVTGENSSDSLRRSAGSKGAWAPSEVMALLHARRRAGPRSVASIQEYGLCIHRSLRSSINEPCRRWIRCTPLPPLLIPDRLIV